MKFRNLLMTLAFLLAVSSTFAFKNRRTGDLMYYSYFSAGKCYVDYNTTDQQNCDASFTGPQCTHGGNLIYFYSLTPPLGAPTCTVPLRTPF